MGFKDVFKKSFLEGFNGMDITTAKIAATLFVTALLALYIFAIYRLVTRKVFYSKNFNIALAAMSLITAAIILAMQSNLVISLGMVGALSIVRFRTAIKDPMDLVFLFWSISIGIICGAGLYEVALVTSVAVTVFILVLDMIPVSRAPMMLVVNSSKMDDEQTVLDVVGKYAKSYKVKSRNLSKGRLDMVVELRVKDESGLVSEVAALDGMIGASLIAHDGEVTF
ncbi:MAG: DUF4956 domain-containing protein [Lachnospiraceae bacterium]|uniref:DUF4956 domain-containing protein n=1 Tax=Hominiventricola filiformis TaxID=2885352 RepID=A0AAE3A5R4_9FIRM|nr:DUF4956 domain-containing protein [Hominiventricola filiformis]MCC2124753.1 DUF4956 domain-containing protein [Hominiventricola filiformis]MCI6881225.1 DUF4956 domain-containing protein [Clostridiaceae bacterium]MDY3826344.1 DUF4956 domain-containing protein [Lachnospiraceae bacterium]QUO22273.1 DUF4956 domain-containing protein [Clostridiaceae bacterium Marseille-Q4143]